LLIVNNTDEFRSTPIEIIQRDARLLEYTLKGTKVIIDGLGSKGEVMPVRKNVYAEN